MRNELVTYIRSLSLGTVSVSNEFPFTKDGESLYLKNFKKIYIDHEETSQEPLFNTMDGGSVVSETTTIAVYLTLDAKTPLVNYDAIVTQLQNARNMVALNSQLDRTVTVAKSYEGDAVVTEFTFGFRAIKTH
jgi:hypothetical protein